jgi:glycosyltransferase involved in cell wall biosynthesis
MDNAIDYEGTIDGVPVIQEKEFHTNGERIRYYFHALTARELVIPYTERAFISAEDSLFQIEDPLFYPLLKKNRISRFILDEHNANWEMYDFAHPDLKKRIYAKVASHRDKENEKLALLHATHILCCSIRDRDILVLEVPEIEDRITIIPNCVNFHEYESPPFSSPEPRKNSKKGQILFVGLMAYAPNVEAARFICEIIAPRTLRCEFIIAGKNPPKLACPENVMFPGYVDDIKSVIASADICIAPIRSGSGTRIKILEYMAMGKPVITTSKGAEGIEYTDGLNIIIEDRIENYPEIIRHLLDDEKKRLALGREGRKLITEKYDWEMYRKRLEKIYRDV